VFERVITGVHRAMHHPFAYDVVRPLLVGGVDLSPLYRQIQRPDAVILDVGCGTGNALRYLERFESYVGMDTNPIAVDHARARYGSSRVQFEARVCTPEDVRRLAPTHVVLAGVLHHLSDSEALDLLGSFAESPRLERVLTADIVFLPGHPVGNWLAAIDRGRFCRTEPGYVDLVARSGLELRSRFVARSHPWTGIGKYLYMTIEPRSAARGVSGGTS
jgi:SAM-dependent methyltransferase